jgi:hypothetical protein
LIVILFIISKADTIDGKNELLIISTKKDESKKLFQLKEAKPKENSYYDFT